jgi:hypothetical protein
MDERRDATEPDRVRTVEVSAEVSTVEAEPVGLQCVPVLVDRPDGSG